MMDFLSDNPQNMFLHPRAGKARLKLAHVGIHILTNAGDTLLNCALRELLQQFLAPIDFTLIQWKQPVTQETIDTINQTDGLIIGGGGLFLKDTYPNDISGWTWACPTELMKKINVPIIVFAIGYSRFRGQPDFDPCFSNNVNELVKLSSFFGLRNYGSIEATRGYVKDEYKEKISFQPCPTTLLSKYYPYHPKPRKEKFIAINCGFDRPQYRFDNDTSSFIKNLASAINALQNEGYIFRAYNHSLPDSKLSELLATQNITMQSDLVGTIPCDMLINFYQDCDYVFAGRGHAQMIPFGLGTPSFALHCHNKTVWFNESINHPEWGAEVSDGCFREKILDFVHQDRHTLNQQLQEAQENLWQVTADNINKLKKIFNIDNSFSFARQLIIENAELKEKCEELIAEKSALICKKNALINSKSWWITKPLRLLSQRIKQK